MVADAITVCICTYRRPHLLSRLLERIAQLMANGRFRLSLVVVDNDGGSAEAVVRGLCDKHKIPVRFDIEKERNFALVRNRAVNLANTELIAFIDDDEVPADDWLLRLHAAMETYQADGILGPVRPYFDENPPEWIIKGRFCERPSHPTGMVLSWNQTRTGNVLLRTDVFRRKGIWFDPAYATGGEDVDFFRRAINAGSKFVWCEEGPVYELVPSERLTRGYFLRRSLVQGGISSKYDRGTLSSLRLALKTVFAVAIYSFLLPLAYVRGEHFLMKYLIKNCHHIGRLAAFVGIRIARS